MNLKCPLCGFEFNFKESSILCKRCSIPRLKCDLVKCPGCGYEILPPKEIYKKIKELVKNGKTPS